MLWEGDLQDIKTWVPAPPLPPNPLPCYDLD